MESICFILFILQVGTLRPQGGVGLTQWHVMSYGLSQDGHPELLTALPGLLPLCYMVSWAERRHGKDEKCKKAKRKSRLKTDKTNVYILYEEEDGEETVP